MTANVAFHRISVDRGTQSNYAAVYRDKPVARKGEIWIEVRGKGSKILEKTSFYSVIFVCNVVYNVACIAYF